MGELVPLVDPLPAELAVTVGARLRPLTFFVAEVLRPSVVDVSDDPERIQHFQAPEGALAFYVPERGPERGPALGPDGQLDVAVFRPLNPTTQLPTPAYAGGGVAGGDTFRVLGVVASPVEDPGLVARHEEELGHLAVYVSGAHTILAHPDDCGGLFPMQFIKVATTIQWKPLLPATDRPFFVPRVERCGVDDPEAFAMVLQVGKAELRILLLQRRFP